MRLTWQPAAFAVLLSLLWQALTDASVCLLSAITLAG